MAFQPANSKLIGNDGKNQFYCSNGVYMARKLYKTPKGVVSTSDNYKDARLAGIEFAACSSLASSLYKDAKVYLPYLHKWYGMAKFTAALRLVVNGCSSPTGQRDLRMSEHKALPVGMELNSQRDFISVFKMPFVTHYDATAKELVTSVSDFIPADLDLKATGASLLRVFCFVVIVEDGALDPKAKRFIYKNDLKPIRSCFSFSDYITLLQRKNVSVSLKTDLKDILCDGNTAHAWVWLGVELCRRNNHTTDVLYNHSVCKLVQALIL
jgi:hypothetical protein